MSLLMNQIVLNATRMAGEPPLVLPAKTIRFLISNESYTPRTYTSTTGKIAGTSMKGTWKRVSTSPNVWDWYYNSSNWAGSSSKALFQLSKFLHKTNFSILGANFSGVTNATYMFSTTTYSGSAISGIFECDGLISIENFTNTNSITDMSYMFYKCSELASMQIFDTSNVTNMTTMFMHCAKITSVPLFNTSKVTKMVQMFCDCKKVKSGALALYQQASSQVNPPSQHSDTFKSCGSSTTTGAAELAQIPSSWGGTGA